MATRGKRQRDITLMQALQRAQGFSPKRWSGIKSVPSISNAASRAMMTPEM